MSDSKEKAAVNFYDLFNKQVESPMPAPTTYTTQEKPTASTSKKSTTPTA